MSVKRWFLLLLLVLMIFPALELMYPPGVLGAKQQSKANKAQNRNIKLESRNKKIEAFLMQVKRAGSIEQVSNAFRMANFSAAERQQLEKELNSPFYKQKLKRLIMSSRKRERVIKKTYKQPRTTKKVNKALIQSKLARAKAIDKQKRARRIPGVRVISKQKIMMMKGYRPSGKGSGAEILSISPNDGQAGTVVTIRGRNFGHRGQVALLVERNLLFADIISWSPERITITIPEAVQALVGEEQKSGFIWIKLAGGENGPYIDFGFRPNASMLVPVISEINPDPIYPSSEILITGNNFLRAHKPVVKARSGSVEVTLKVTDWSDTYIYVKSGGDYHSTLERIPSGGFMISVENHLGASVSKPVTMARRIVRRRVRFSQHEVHCEYWKDSEDRPSALCWIGYKKTFSSSYGGCRDWSVVGYTVRIVEQGCCSGYSFKKEPFGNRPDYEIELWANAFGYIKLYVEVEMEGPEGTFCY